MGTIKIILARGHNEWEEVKPIIGTGHHLAMKALLTGKKQVMVEVDDISNEMVQSAIQAFDQGYIDFMEYRGTTFHPQETTRLIRIYGNWKRTWL